MWERQQGVSAPIWFDVEAPAPFPAPKWSGVVASPALIAAETWDGLIAGARGFSYFDYDFCTPGCGYGTANGQGLTGSSRGGTYTFAQLQSQVTETDGLVHLLAPILNSPFANRYISSTVTGSGNRMGTMTKWESASSSDARCGESRTGCFYVFSAPKFNRSAQTGTYTFRALSASMWSVSPDPERV